MKNDQIMGNLSKWFLKSCDEQHKNKEIND